MDPMIGMIFMVPWNWAPLNYQLCQGQLLTVQQYEALYSLMGFVFGGNGSSNFNLPNLQGRTPIGTGTLNASLYTLGNVGGAQTTTLTQAQMPAHVHGATFVPVVGQQVVTIPGTTGTLSATATSSLKARQVAGANTPQNNFLLGSGGSAGGAATIYVDPTTAGTDVTLGGLNVGVSISGTASTPATNATINSVTNGTVGIGIAGASSGFSNMQPYLAMSFIIAVNGLYPDRP